MTENYREHANDFPSAIDRLYTIISILRAPGGCPWDRVQTNKSTTISLIDESYEYLDGVLKKNIESEREEIGDIMINVFMNLYIHDENKDFRPEEAVNEVCDKLIRRHPHVFGDEHAENASEVLSLWNSVKENIEGHKDKADSFFAHIPSYLPPLEESYEIQKKLKKVGFDWPDAAGVVAKVEEELEEVNEAIAEGDEDHLEMELGDLLFSVVNLCRFMKIRPNVALHRCNEKVKSRFQRLFDLAAEKGIPINKERVDEMNDLWKRRRKKRESDNGTEEPHSYAVSFRALLPALCPIFSSISVIAEGI